MKCELCHKKEASTAIVLQRNGVEEELYVCNECANKERLQQQKKQQCTRNLEGLPPGMSVSITQLGGNGEEPPPQILEALMSAMSDVVSDFKKKVNKEAPSIRLPNDDDEKQDEAKYRTFPCARVDHEFRIGKRLHLEGLHLIGEIEAIERSFRALNMKLVGVTADGVIKAGHVFTVSYACPFETAKRVVSDLLARERDARNQLLNSMPRVFGDALCRAMAVLKNCRLASPGEVFDLLSPLRLAAMWNLLDGTSLDQIEGYMLKICLASHEDKISVDERDIVDANRADIINKRFKGVLLNKRAKELFE